MRATREASPLVNEFKERSSLSLRLSGKDANEDMLIGGRSGVISCSETELQGCVFRV